MSKTPGEFLQPPEIQWFLCGQLAEGQPMAVIPIKGRMVIGRRRGLELTVQSSFVSGQHAEISFLSNRIVVRDLGSRNGTYVNEERIKRATYVGVGDVINIADIKLRVHCRNPLIGEGESEPYDEMHRNWVLSQFQVLMTQEAVLPVLQPIVSVKDGSVLGYETLARSNVSGVETPERMFDAARMLALESKLSDICRRAAVATSTHLADQAKLFLNTHSTENLKLEVLPSLENLREQYPQASLVVEIEDAPARSVQGMADFINAMPQLDIEWAMERFLLSDLPFLRSLQQLPKYVKLHEQLLKGIVQRQESEQQQIRMAIEMIQHLGVQVIASRVEDEEDGEMIAQLGVDFVQGHAFGEPLPLPSIPLMETEAFRLSDEPSLKPPILEEQSSQKRGGLRKGLSISRRCSGSQKRTLAIRTTDVLKKR